MGGEGSMQAMNTIIRNNRNYLRKKRMYKRERKVNVISDNKKLKFKKLSNSEIEKYKIELRLKFKKEENLRVICFTLFVLIISSIFLYGVYLEYQKDEERTAQNKLYQLKINRKKHLYLIEDGDKWLLKKHYKNAAFQYKKALELFPEDSVTKIKLLEIKGVY